MFEKEAEEYAERTKTKKEIKVLNTVHDWGQESLSPDERRLFEGILDREEARKQGFQEGAEFGYNKANEWHYVKDGLPELHDVLCFVIHNEHRFVLQGYLRDGRWVLSPLGTYLNNDDVIAWKEIVLPELKESE